MSADLASPATVIVTPGDPGWDDARQAWNLTVDQHPAAVALAASAQDVVNAEVREIIADGLPGQPTR
jgi:hypothetical protein